MSETVLIPRAETNANSASRAISVLWAATIFLSAFLLFQVEPILAKMILPWFGGGAGVWTAALMFFQVTYLLGNLYAHSLIRYASPVGQSRVHIALLAASLFLLPILPNALWKPTGGGDPTLRILGLLAVTVGVPFLLLSATSPLLQAWYVRGTPPASGGAIQPYRFYALSNAGSLLGLLSYPVLVEPHLTTRHQAIGWSVAYGVFVASCAWAASRPVKNSATPADAVAGEKPNWIQLLLWIALATDASALLLSVTTHLSQNVAAVPLLWVVPLSLYLLSLILCFEGRGWYNRFLFLRLGAVALGGMAYALSPDFANVGPMIEVPLFCVGLFICCMVCHGELAKIKPAPEHLTLFYLMLSLGGALGGIFVGVIAPRIFRGFWELPIALAACGVLLVIVLRRDPTTDFHKGWRHPAFPVAAALAALLCVSLIVITVRQAQSTRVMVRNFYGMLRVGDFPQTFDQPAHRELFNGTIIHGLEILANDQRMQPTSYFGPQSGAGFAMAVAHERGNVRAGIIGLGAGTLAAYGEPGDRFTFYEINPLVIELAHSQFGFLGGSKAQVDIILGDARLSLEREAPQNFDLFLVDAFSGDAIPVHLLTREAFELYFRQLKPDGVLAIHVSNKFLDLRPVVEAAARNMNLNVTTITNWGDPRAEIYTSTWMLLSRSALRLQIPMPPPTPEESTRHLRMWTDDYSNLLQILK